MDKRTTLLPMVGCTIDPVALRRLWAWTTAAKTEISGLGEIEVLDGCFHVPNVVHLLKQKGSPASTALDMGAVADLVDAYMRSGRNAQRLRFWFHSHPKMPAFFSGTDDNTIASLNKTMPSVLAGVFNEKGETSWRLVLPEGRIFNWEYLISGSALTKQELEMAKEEVKEFVREESWLERWGGHVDTWEFQWGFKKRGKYDKTAEGKTYHRYGSGWE